MQHVTRNLLLLAVMGFTLFGFTNVDARYSHYRVDVGQTSYNIGIYDYNVNDSFQNLERDLEEICRQYDNRFSTTDQTTINHYHHFQKRNRS